MNWTYFLIDIFSFSIPFLFSFHPKMKLIQWWKPIFISIGITALFFISWDKFSFKNENWLSINIRNLENRIVLEIFVN